MLEAILYVIYGVGWITFWTFMLYKADDRETKEAFILLGWLVSLLWPLLVLGAFLNHLMELLKSEEKITDVKKRRAASRCA